MRTRDRLRHRARLLSPLLAIALGSGPVLVGGGSAHADEDHYACNAVQDIEAGSTPSEPSPIDGPVPPDPFQGELQIRAAQQAAPQLGARIKVAVIDSGVNPSVLAPQAQAHYYQAPGFEPPTHYHGTVVAGIIAGAPSSESPIGGIAPSVTVEDFPVWHTNTGEGDPIETGVVEGDLIRALQQLAGKGGRLDHLIVNMSLDTTNTATADQLRGPIQQLIGRGAIVVAAGGNRAGDDSNDPSATPSPYTGTEDRAGTIFPAAFPGVVAVGAAYTSGMEDGVGDPTQYVFANSDIDVAAPTPGLRSRDIQARPCVVTDVATSWSTPVVTGSLALLWSKYYDETAPQIIRRLEDTAAGRPGQGAVFVGSGIVQPYDALTRPLGAPERSRPQAVPQASVAPPRADVLKGTRHDAMWWGLLGGGALILALILRPLFARRRDH